MKKITLAGIVLANCSATFAQFNAAQPFVATTPDPLTVISGANLNDVPAYSVSGPTSSNLQSLYGSNILTPGQAKSTNCATLPTPTHSYLNEECNTINFINNNKATRMNVPISNTTDPTVVNANSITSNPSAHTVGTPNLSGAYTACSTSSTSTPASSMTERCQVGNEVTQSTCSVPLVVTVQWALFNNQPNADTAYGYCPAGNVRGDQSTAPIINSYVTNIVTCASYGLGTGMATVEFLNDCFGNKTLVGYNSSGCQIKASPVSVVPSYAWNACLNAPRTNTNCFGSNLKFTTVTTVPLVTDTKDNSACAGHISNTATIL